MHAETVKTSSLYYFLPDTFPPVACLYFFTLAFSTNLHFPWKTQGKSDCSLFCYCSSSCRSFKALSEGQHGRLWVRARGSGASLQVSWKPLEPSAFSHTHSPAVAFSRKKLGKAYYNLPTGYVTWLYM